MAASKTAKTTLEKTISTKKETITDQGEHTSETDTNVAAKATKSEAKPAAAKATKAAKAAPSADAPEALSQAASDTPEAKPARKPAKKEEGATEPGNKATAKSSIKYDPDFTRSVLDASMAKNEPVMQNNRYSDSDLAEFRELILRKLESAKKELAYLQGVITRKDETGGDNDARYMTMEDGSLSMEREQVSQMASRQITYIDHLEKALIRIENKTYGICRVTGKLIDKSRLRAVPHATLSVEAKMGKVKS
jgi:RNA polymerase-binding transcription factor DksA